MPPHVARLISRVTRACRMCQDGELSIEALQNVADGTAGAIEGDADPAIARSLEALVNSIEETLYVCDERTHAARIGQHIKEFIDTMAALGWSDDSDLDGD